MIRVRARHGALLAIPVGVAGFALAGTVLAASVAPTAWNPVVDPAAAASVTDVGDRSDVESPVSNAVYVYVFPKRPTFAVERVPVPVPVPTTVPLPPPRIDGELGIPQIVLAAYRAAAETLAEVDSSCRLRWEVLAGVGRVESGHARDGLVYADGTTFEPILGPRLDGGAFAAIPDTDDGVLDGDTVWDRAVGPMQFIPGTWAAVGADGNDDGNVDPHNIFDAALSAGRYLCAGSADLGDRAGLERALLRYNHSAAYVALVMAWIDGYAAGQVTPIPPRPPPPPTQAPPTTAPPTTAPTTSPTTTDPTTTDPTTSPTTTGPAINPTTPPTTSDPPPTTSDPPPTTSDPPATEPATTSPSTPSRSPTGPTR